MADNELMRINNSLTTTSTATTDPTKQKIILLKIDDRMPVSKIKSMILILEMVLLLMAMVE